MKKTLFTLIGGLMIASLIFFTISNGVTGEDPKETPTPTPTDTPPDPTPSPTATADPKDPCGDCTFEEELVIRCWNCREIEGNPFGACEEYGDGCGGYSGCSWDLLTKCVDGEGNDYPECCQLEQVSPSITAICGRPLLPDGSDGDCQCDFSTNESGTHDANVCKDM